MRAKPETPPMLEKKSLAVYIANIFEILCFAVFTPLSLFHLKSSF